MPDLLETKPRNQTGNQRILGMQKGGEKMNIWLANTLIEIAWLGLTGFLVYTGHWIWAIFTLFGAFICGYSYKKEG